MPPRDTPYVCVTAFRWDECAWSSVHPYHHWCGKHKQRVCYDTILYRLRTYNVRFGFHLCFQRNGNQIPYSKQGHRRDTAGFGNKRAHRCALSVTSHQRHVRRVFSDAQIVLNEPGPARSPAILRDAQSNVSFFSLFSLDTRINT